MDDVVIPSSRPVISCYMPLIFSIIAIWMIIYPDSDPSLALLVPFGIRVFSAYLAARLRERASFFFFFCFSGEPCMGNGVLSSFSIVFSANFLYPMRLFHPFSFLHKIFVITSMNRLIPPSRESPASVSQSILLFFSFSAAQTLFLPDIPFHSDPPRGLGIYDTCHVRLSLPICYHTPFSDPIPFLVVAWP